MSLTRIILNCDVSRIANVVFAATHEITRLAFCVLRVLCG